jgi:hypothetical protein
MDRWNLWQSAQERKEYLVQPREARLGLELDAASPEDVQSRSRRFKRCGIQQAGLADTRLPSHQQGSARGPGRSEERADAVHFRLAPEQLTGWATVHSPFVVLWRVDLIHWC